MLVPFVLVTDASEESSQARQVLKNAGLLGTEVRTTDAGHENESAPLLYTPYGLIPGLTAIESWIPWLKRQIGKVAA